MSRDSVYLLDILESARLAVQYLVGMTPQEFLANAEKQDAVVRRIEIIGEAAGRVSPETRSQLDKMPWSSMKAMRNLMIHQYDVVDMAIVWDTVQRDLPPLIRELEKVVDPPDDA